MVGMTDLGLTACQILLILNEYACIPRHPNQLSSTLVECEGRCCSFICTRGGGDRGTGGGGDGLVDVTLSSATTIT